MKSTCRLCTTSLVKYLILSATKAVITLIATVVSGIGCLGSVLFGTGALVGLVIWPMDKAFERIGDFAFAMILFVLCCVCVAGFIAGLRLNQCARHITPIAPLSPEEIANLRPLDVLLRASSEQTPDTQLILLRGAAGICEEHAEELLRPDPGARS